MPTQIRGDEQIKDATVDTLQLKNAAVTGAKIADDTIDASLKLQENTLTIPKLTDFYVRAGTGALKIDVFSGRVRKDNVIAESAIQDELSVTDNATNYVEVDFAGAISVNTSGFTAGRCPLATVVTATGAIVSVNDKRALFSIEESIDEDFIDNETPSGDLDGIDVTYTLVNAPSPTTSLKVYKNGLRLKETTDYTLAGSTITFVVAPQASDILLADYRK